MSQSRRLLFYLVLNILVSACTTLAVLVIWERTHPASPLAVVLPGGQEAATAPASLTAVAGPTAAATAGSPQPDAEGSIVLIENVFGAGDLANEVVMIKRSGSGELTLTGWQLSSGGETYTFPALVLYTGGAVQVHTAAGVNTVVDLYWGLDHAIWQSGATVSLLDPLGKVYATYRIP